MSRGNAIRELFRKSILPVTTALLLVCIFQSACVRDGTIDYVWLWILCGLLFGIHRMRLLVMPGGSSFGGGIAIFALSFILGGVIGGFVLVWCLLAAAWYMLLTTYRLTVGQ